MCYLSKAVLLNRGAHAPLGGEFEKLRGEILKKGNWGVNYTQRGEVVIGQMVWCQLDISRPTAKINKVSTKDKNSCSSKSSPKLALIIMLFVFSNNLLQTKITSIYAMKKRTFVVKIQYFCLVIVYTICHYLLVLIFYNMMICRGGGE